jgi:hypothetical protein
VLKATRLPLASPKAKSLTNLKSPHLPSKKKVGTPQQKLLIEELSQTVKVLRQQNEQLTTRLSALEQSKPPEVQIPVQPSFSQIPVQPSFSSAVICLFLIYERNN